MRQRSSITHILKAAWIVSVLHCTRCTNLETNLVNAIEDNPTSPPQFVELRRMENNIRVKQAGSSDRLSCRATGNPKPTIVWYKDGIPLRESSTRVTLEGYTLHLTELSKNDSGEYLCAVSNAFGVIQWSYNLEIQERFRAAPTVVCNHRNRTVTEGDDVTFHCDVYSYLTAFVRWIKHYHVNGSYFDLNGAPHAKLVKDAAEVNVTDPYTLTLSNVSLNDAGFYTLLANSLSGASHQTVSLRVVPKPFLGL